MSHTKQLSFIMKNKLIATMVLTCFAGLAQAQNNVAAGSHVQEVTAISRVLGDGRKVETIILQYDAPIKNKSLRTESFRVEGKEVTRLYANSAPERAEQGKDGKYVVIEVKAEVDLDARPPMPTEADMAKKRERDRMQGGPGLRAGWSTGGDDKYPGNATMTQTADIKTCTGKTYKATGEPIESTVERCRVADDFKQATFISPFTGQALPYNIYVPEDYDPAVKYPLVLFIHDAGVASGEVTHTLYQGNGATSWAEPEAQARHKCIVVAPEYPFITVDDT